VRVKKEFGELPDESRRYYIIRCIIDDQVKDVVKISEAAIAESGVKSSDDVRLQAKPLIRYSTERRLANLELRKYLYQNLYYNPEVHEPNRRAVRMLEELFRYFSERPKEIGPEFRKRARKEGWPRSVCDYLACMTDRFAVQEYQRLFGVNI
jgi:dGTPase